MKKTILKLMTVAMLAAVAFGFSTPDEKSVAIGDEPISTAKSIQDPGGGRP